MPDAELLLEPEVERMLAAARGGLSPHELLVRNSLAERANVAERSAAIAKNRERAMKLLAALEQTPE
ncbi:MAG TPA: hypothetical protein VF096_16345 [Azonexus sp.]